MQRTLIPDAAAGQPAYPIYNTSGFLMANITHAFSNQLSLAAYDYQFYDIANMVYAPKSDGDAVGVSARTAMPGSAHAAGEAMKAYIAPAGFFSRKHHRAVPSAR
jgi:hypothetical protein